MDRLGDTAFRNRGPDGRFVGELTDPMPVRWTADGTTLTVDERRSRWD